MPDAATKSILDAVVVMLRDERERTEKLIDARLGDPTGRDLYRSISLALLDQKTAALQQVVTGLRFEKATGSSRNPAIAQVLK